MKRSRSPSSSMIPASSASVRPASAAPGSARSTSTVVGSAAAATIRATSIASRAEALDALAQELVERRGERKRVAGRWGTAATLDRACELEREEGIAARRLPQPEQGRPRERRLEPALEELAERADAQPVDVDRHEPLGQAPSQPRRRLAACREQNGERLLVEACEDEPESGGRRGVEPLEIVDGEAELPVADEEIERGAERRGHGALVRRSPLLAQEQGGLERPPLDRRQLGEDVVDDAPEEVAQAGVREPGLGLGRPAREDAVAARPRGVDPCEPERRLADPRLAVEEQRAGKQPPGSSSSRSIAASSSSRPISSWDGGGTGPQLLAARVRVSSERERTPSFR